MTEYVPFSAGGRAPVDQSPVMCERLSRGRDMGSQVMVECRRISRRSRDVPNYRADALSSFEDSMELEPTDPTSATLLGRVGLGPGDHVAWARFVELYGSRIRGWCRRWGLQEADSEDVTQDVLLRLAQKLGTFQYDPARSFRGWLRTVTQHALADFLAARKRQCSGSGDDAVLEQLQTVAARDDLIEHLKDQFDSEIVAMASARAGRGSSRRRGRPSGSRPTKASQATTWRPGSG